MSYFGGLSLSQSDSRKGEKTCIFSRKEEKMWCEKKAAGQPCPLACSRPRSLNCGVKPPTPMGKNPRSLLQGSEDVHHQGGGGGGGEEGCSQ